MAFFTQTAALAQTPALSAKYLSYIEKYKSIALKHQKEYGIPASITLAQGLLESQCGNSRLAKDGNNHFGIKCYHWSGDTILHDDDELQDCFRRYATAEESFADHAQFLKKKRYEPLFAYKVSDYKSWANTLRKCGYATDPNYPSKLIGIIETYELDKLADGDAPVLSKAVRNDAKKKAEARDKKKKKHEKSTEPAPTHTAVSAHDDLSFAEEVGEGHIVHVRYGLRYVVAHDDESFHSLADELGISARDLAKYNDSNTSVHLNEGDVVWLQQKEKKAAEGNDEYTVREGDTLRLIAQRFGIRMKELAKMNGIVDANTLAIGDVLKLR